MGDYIAVSPQTLRLIASYFDEPIKIVHETNNEYIFQTDNLGPVWGDDNNGMQWANVYLPTHQNIVDTHGAIEQGLKGMQLDLYLMADNYDKTDNYNSM